ncbi:MAG: efflux transporter outer membrane subunit [Proteobacteria bacterium]|nr:efflux transporter outer membrane subunit [Pseudomonadota bacterium]
MFASEDLRARRTSVAKAAATAAALALAACAAGPDFKAPAPPKIATYSPDQPSVAAGAPGVAGGAAQRIGGDVDLPGDWWTLFHSQPLNDLIAQALKANTDLGAARAALRQAHETTLAQRGAFFPGVSASFSGARFRQSGDLAPTPINNASEYSLFTPQVSVSYAPDVFGLTRRTVENARAQEEASRFQMLATDLTLTTNVANAAIQDASINAQVEATRELIDLQTRSVEVLRLQLAKGYASGLDLAAQENQLAQLKAALPPLLKQAAQQHDLIAALTGRFPVEAPATRFTLDSLTLPADLPLSLPSRLVAQRPDVRQAEANLHAASAAIGVAEANRLPNFTLTGDYGSSALTIQRVFHSGTGFWDFGAAVTAPIFQGGALLHQARAAKAAYQQAAEQYRGAVLGAVQNVADTLAAIQQDAAGLKAAAAAEAAAKSTLDLTERQNRAGYASYLALLAAQQAYQQARISLVQAQASRFSDTVALYQALGGGWWRRADLVKDAHAN